MQRLLQKVYFWRYSNQSVAEYIKNCLVCQKSIGKPVKKVTLGEPEPWSLVELHCLGPFEQSKLDNQQLAVLFDPATGWVAASPFKSSGSDLSLFLLDTMCNFGIACCSVFGLNCDEFDKLKKRYFSTRHTK